MFLKITAKQVTGLLRSLTLPIVLSAAVFNPAFASAAETLEIWQIQSQGDMSPWVGATVTTEDNIVTAVGTNGFFMQTPAERSDNNPATSDGILVYTQRRPEVVQGDLVTVTGEITEYYGMTEFDNSGLEIIVTGSAPLPEPVVLDAPFPSEEPHLTGEFEQYEGMLVQVSGAVAVGPAVRYYKGQPQEEYEIPVVYGHARSFREPGLAYPASGEDRHITVFDNNPQIFEFGFGGGADSQDFATLDVNIHTGAVLSGTGVINYRFERYQLWPLAGTLTIDTSSQLALPRPVSAPGESEFTVGTQNVLNLFDLDRDRGKDDRNDTPRTVEIYEHQLGKLAAQICDVLLTPDILALQEVEKLETLAHPDPSVPDLTSAIEDHCGVSYTAFLIEGNDGRGIDNGYLVTDRVSVLDVYQVGSEEMFRPSVATGPEILYDRPPLILNAIIDPEGAAFPITVINVHMKSYSQTERPRYRELRFQQSIFLAQFIQELQAEDRNINLVVLGDFNAYQFSDGIAPNLQIIAGTVAELGNENSSAVWWPEEDYVEPDLIMQTANLDATELYSYVYDGSAQELDHILTSATLDRYVTRVEYSRGNADASFGYDELANDPLRSSDHDGAVIAISTEGYTTASGSSTLIALIIGAVAAIALAVSGWFIWRKQTD